MDAGYVIISVLVALLSVWGALSIGRGLYAWLFAPPQVRGCVLLDRVTEPEDLELLLIEAERNCFCRKGAPLVVIVTPEIARALDIGEEAPKQGTHLEGELADCLEGHGAILLICERGDICDTPK